MILVVDDDEIFRERMTQVLRLEGYETTGAGTLALAEDALRRAPLELVIVDGLLPDGTGIELIERMRAIGITVPVVFVTAYWQDQHTRTLLNEELDVARIIHKPVTPTDVWVQIADLLGATRKVEAEGGLDAAALAELRAQYLPMLRTQTESLIEELTAMMAPAGGDAALEKARRLAHNIYGTAGSFGFEEVSELASHIEAWLRPLVERKDSLPTRAGWKRAMGLARRANEALGRADMGSSPPRRGTARLLVVHDDPGVLARFNELGTATLTEIVGVSSQKQAQAHLGLGWFDGAIVGMDCASFDGLSVANILSGPEGEGLPFGMLLRTDAVYDRLAAIYAGAVSVVREDCEPETLGEVVTRLSNARREERSRVLLLDDDEAFGQVVKALLERQGVDVWTATQGDRIFELLDEVRPELLLLDIAMPGVSGLDVCRMIRASPEHDELPVLFLSALSDDRARLACYRAGGDDVLSKPLVPEELYARVLGRLERERLRRDRRDRDPLTGLLTRRAFLERFDTALTAAGRSGEHVSLLLIDLDEFKQINDTHGHAVGDQVLAMVGRVLRARFRPDDLRGRWGGDELVVSIVGEGTETATESVERLRRELARLFETEWRGPPLTPGLSCGIAVFPREGERADRLFIQADERLYEAKRRGRGRTVAIG